VSGLASVIGPLIGTSLMARFGINGLLYFMAASTLFLSLIAGGGSLIKAAPHRLRRTFEILAPQAVLLAHDSLSSDDSSSPSPAETS
jgi:hypothetical protein